MKTPTFIILIAALLWSGSLLGQASPNITDGRFGLSYAATVRTLTSSNSISSKDHTILANATSGNLVLSLPAIRDKWQVVVIKKTDSSAYYVRINPSGSDTIDGFANYVLVRQNQTVTLQAANDASWKVLNPGAGSVTKISLGAVANDAVAATVADVDMKVGTYTIAAQPDVPRNITVTHTADGTVDTLGTIVIVGTDYLGDALTETLTPVNGTIAAGTKAFRSITSITGVGWVIAAGNDNVSLGRGALIGLPIALSSATGVALGTLGGTAAGKATTGTTIPTSTVAEASGDGSAELVVYLDR
jgi:hypothetical protein